MENYIIIGIIIVIAFFVVRTIVKAVRVAVAAEVITNPERRNCKL